MGPRAGRGRSQATASRRPWAAGHAVAGSASSGRPPDRPQRCASRLPQFAPRPSLHTRPSLAAHAGCGKSTLARALAAKLGLNAVNLGVRRPCPPPPPPTVVPLRLTRAVSGTAALLQVSNVFSGYLGESERAVRAAFGARMLPFPPSQRGDPLRGVLTSVLNRPGGAARARAAQPCALIVDDVDILCGRRAMGDDAEEGGGVYPSARTHRPSSPPAPPPLSLAHGAHSLAPTPPPFSGGVAQRVLTTFLTEMDGIDSAAAAAQGVAVEGATPTTPDISSGRDDCTDPGKALYRELQASMGGGARGGAGSDGGLGVVVVATAAGAEGVDRVRAVLSPASTPFPRSRAPRGRAGDPPSAVVSQPDPRGPTRCTGLVAARAFRPRAVAPEARPRRTGGRPGARAVCAARGPAAGAQRPGASG